MDVGRHTRNWPIWNHERRIKLVGHWFATLTQRMLGGKFAKRENATGDIEHHAIETIIEVKGCASPGYWRVFLCQLDDLQSLVNGFTYNACAYVLWAYRDWRGSPRRNGKPTWCREMTRLTPKERDLHRFLAERTTEAYVFDADIIAAMSKKKSGRMRSVRNGEEYYVARLNKTRLRAFCTNTRDCLREVGLDPDRFRVARVRVRRRFRHFWTSFTVHLLLRNDHLEQVIAELKKRNRELAFEPH